MRSPRSVLSFLPIAFLLVLLVASSAQVGEVWETAHSERYHVYDFVDLDGDSSLELLTGEYVN